MICTSVLLFFYLHGVREMKVFPWAFVIFFVALEDVYKRQTQHVAGKARLGQRVGKCVGHIAAVGIDLWFWCN